MSIGAIQVLFLIACVHQSTSTYVEEVKTRWTYKINNARSLPDSIQVDLELEGGKITMDLIKQSMESIGRPMILTQFEGQRSLWKPSEDEFLGIYKDPSYDASATVSVREFDEIKETLYTIAFSHGNKSFTLEPNDNFLEKLYLEKNKSNEDKINNNNNSKLLNIDGKLHSLVEFPTRVSQQNVSFQKDHVTEAIKKLNIGKRSVAKRLMTVKVFTMIDYNTFLKYFELSNASSNRKEDTMKTIHYIFTHIMEEVKNAYESIDLDDLRFTIKWVGALVAQSPSDVPFLQYANSGDLDGDLSLKKMSEWNRQEEERQDKTENKLPKYDALVAITSNGIIYGRTPVSGLASGHEICDPTCLNLASHVHSYDTINTIAHELGHCFGSDHDNEVGCNDKFIMSPGGRNDNGFYFNYHRFSKCSIDYLEKKIKRLDREKNNCLTDESEDFHRGKNKDMFLQLYPGQIYDLDDQCRMIYGPKSFYCGGMSRDRDMCQIIYCFEEYKCVSEASLGAMDGTSCSNGSWCLKGECTPDSRAPRAPGRCVTGDNFYSRKNKRKTKCSDRAFWNPRYCPLDIFDQCCASCSTVTMGFSNVNECNDLKPRDCYNNYYNVVCSETCKALVQNPSDNNCLYGDKGSNCSELVPEVCHLSTRFCCQSCAVYQASTNGTKST